MILYIIISIKNIFVAVMNL